MQRSLVVALALLLLGLAVTAWLLLRDDAPLPLPGNGPEAATPAAAQPVATGLVADGGSAGAALREAAPDARGALLADPEIRAGLCGFKGRVVTHAKQPVGDCGVRIYRGAMDSVLPVDFDLFAEAPANPPQYIAGEVRTAADGTWQLTGVWPRAFYVLFAGIGTDSPMHQVIARTPGPGEMVDLGDIVLPNSGVLVGTVLDDNGDPLAGALVRAADLPGSLAGFVPLERFDPDGAVLVRERQSPIRVVELPPWVKHAFEHLPIPAARTGVDGRFRLVGVVPASNLLATTAPGFLSDVKPSVPVRAGQEKDVGKIRLKRGEELTGKVVDTAGKPVPGAEVLAGSTLSLGPFDFAQRLGQTDAEGRFRGDGFSAGKVTVAARRGRGHAWVLAEPQSILGDVVVTLPATFAIEATVTLADGAPAKSPRLQLLQGRAGNGAAEMFLLGVVPPVDLRERKQQVADGRWRFTNLAPGSYTLLADAPGHATGFATVDVVEADTSVAIVLTAPAVFLVSVSDPQNQPVRNASVYAQGRGKSAIDMPVLCGRTGPDGRLRIDKLEAQSLRVSADHPRWGVVHGEAKLGEELALRLEAPGALQGVIRENGKPPTPGKFSIALERMNGSGPRGPLETVPGLITPGLDGTFTCTTLQPGEYNVHAVKALDALRSPGGILTMAQEMYMARNLPREMVRVGAGETAQVALEAGDKPLEGPTAQVIGSVTVDGRLANGYLITARAKEHRFTARVDERGRFDLGTVTAGGLSVTVLATTDGMFVGDDETLWSERLELTAGEVRELAISVQTAAISGTCVRADGEPAAGANVEAEGNLSGQGGVVTRRTPTNAAGEFHFANLAEGTWKVRVRSSRGRSVRAELAPVELRAGNPIRDLRLQLPPQLDVKGRVDLAGFSRKPDWLYMTFHRLGPNDAEDHRGERMEGVGVDTNTGAFQSRELTPGRYRLLLHVHYRSTTEDEDDPDNGEYSLPNLEVTATGASDLVLRPGARVTR